MILDIDHFKQINDRFGLVVGDDILNDLVALIAAHTRRYDQLFRFGGEEFVLLLPGVGSVDLKTVVAGLQRIVRQYLHGPGGPVTVSYGVAMLKAGETAESWLTRADHALYRAKEAGRNRVIFADDSKPERETESIRRSA